MSDIRRMTIGQVVDFCIVWNKRNNTEDNKETDKPKKRKATQRDIDAFFG